MSKKKILIVVDKLVYHGAKINGPARYFSSLLSTIDKSKYAVTLVSLRGDTGADNLFADKGFQVIYLGKSKFNIFAFIELNRLIRELSIEALHLSGYGATTVGRASAFLCHVPAIIQEHWVDPNMPIYMRALEFILAPFTWHAIAISDYARDFLINKMKVPAKKVTLIRNGIRLDRFYKTDQGSALKLRTELGIDPETTLIGIIAMLDENKGHRYLIKAMPEIVKAHPDSMLIIVGEGEMSAELHALCKQSGVDKNVRFLGLRNDIAVIDNALDVFVMASYSETAPLALLEAMASGCTIVTTACGGATEVVKDKVSALVVPIRDASAIANAIITVLSDKTLARHLSDNALADSKNFDMTVTTHKIEKLYDQACLYRHKK